MYRASTKVSEIGKGDGMGAAELVAGYKAYTDASELGAAVVTGDRATKEPTPTVTTTSLNCYHLDA